MTIRKAHKLSIDFTIRKGKYYVGKQCGKINKNICAR